ncbi:hypothetical protein DFH09DRAFT_1404904 [Mycena vulgaris]|nr:hypothetical protein DFH09DRAFT_1404904 [Mycena vulgaris]
MASSSTGRNATPGPSAGGGTAGSGGPQAGEKRRAQSPADDPSGAKKSRRGKAKTKAKISEYHVKPDEIPEEYKGTKECIHLHGYILYGICASDIAPPLPTPAYFEAFNQRFEPGFLEALKAKLTKPLAPNEGAAAMVKQLRDQAESELKRGSHIAKAILRIKDNFLTDIFSAVLTAGLIHWCPDLMSPSDTVYNKAHALIFIETFKSVAGSFAYRQLAPIPSGVNNHGMITRLFESFAFGYMRDKARAETKEAGKLAQNREDSNISRRRKTMCDKRVEYARPPATTFESGPLFAEKNR